MKKQSEYLNGIDHESLAIYTELITIHPEEAISSYGITAEWQGGVNSSICTHDQHLGSKRIAKSFEFEVGEPKELLGDHTSPTPQDYLLGGLAGCMMVGFVVGASKKNIRLESVKLHIIGKLDLRGFLNLNKSSAIGFPKLNFQFEVTGDGSQDQYNDIIAKVRQFSPNYRTISDAVEISIIK